MRKAFKFYNSYFKIASELSDKDRLAFYDALLKKQFENIEPDLKGMAKFAYISQKHSIDAQVKGYIDKTGVNIDPMQGAILAPMIDPKQEEKEKEKEKEELLKTKKVSFQNSELFDKNKFKDYFPEWNKTKLAYYYDSAISYSLEGHKYVNWGAAVNNWAKRDELQGKLKFEEPEKQKVIIW